MLRCAPTVLCSLPLQSIWRHLNIIYSHKFIFIFSDCVATKSGRAFTRLCYVEMRRHTFLIKKTSNWSCSFWATGSQNSACTEPHYPTGLLLRHTLYSPERCESALATVRLHCQRVSGTVLFSLVCVHACTWRHMYNECRWTEEVLIGSSACGAWRKIRSKWLLKQLQDSQGNSSDESGPDNVQRLTGQLSEKRGRMRINSKSRKEEQILPREMTFLPIYLAV